MYIILGRSYSKSEISKALAGTVIVDVRYKKGDTSVDLTEDNTNVAIDYFGDDFDNSKFLDPEEPSIGLWIPLDRSGDTINIPIAKYNRMCRIIEQIESTHEDKEEYGPFVNRMRKLRKRLDKSLRRKDG